MALLCLVSGCAAPVCQPMLEARLFFGLTDEAGFVDFLDREVTPRFPAGLTVLDGAGRWRDSSGRPTQERSRVVDIVTVAGADTEARLEAIRAAYKTRFRQQSVGLVLQRVCADF
jgi:hypothetical protein